MVVMLSEGYRRVGIMQLPHVFLEIEIATKALVAVRACIGFFIVVGVHVEGEIVYLMKSFTADVALIGLLAAVGQLVVFVVAFLMESFATTFADPRLVAIVDANVSVESGAAIERFLTVRTLVWFFCGVNYFVATQSAGLSKAFAAHFANERPSSCVYGHVTGQVIVSVEIFATLRTNE